MESFRSMLSAGGHKNSLGRSIEVYSIVKSKPRRINELFDCISDDDAWIRMRAIDTFEKLVSDSPEVALPYTNTSVEVLTTKSQPSIQWHLAQLFAEVELNPAQFTKAVVWLKARISTTGVDWIVSVNVMKTLLHFYKKNLVDRDELIQLFTVQATHKSKTVRKKADQFVEILQEQPQ